MHIRKSKIKLYKLVATLNSNKTSKENLNEQDDIFVDNTDKKSFKMLLEDGAIVKS